jgi:peroxiredoxin
MRPLLRLTPFVFVTIACASPSPPAAAGSPGSPAPQDAAPPADAESAPASAPAPAAEPAGSPIADGAKAELGKPAPDFTLVDLEGKTHKLSDHAGKVVVLEWFNPECPFVNYAHTEGPLVTTAADMTSQGVVWLAINSNAAGKQGHDPAVNTKAAEKFGMKHPILRDETGAVGRAYGAEKTPHMYLIDTAGVLQYAGGIDNAPFGEVDGGAPKRGHLVEALTDVRAGKPVRVPTAPAWGCTVKYG